MAIIAAPLISGLIAGLGGSQLIQYVLINAGMSLWARRKNKKKDSTTESFAKSTSVSTTISIGDPIPIVFGSVVLGGNLFDQFNPPDGSWPVVGSIGYALPKDFNKGVFLANRGSQAYPPALIDVDLFETLSGEPAIPKRLQVWGTDGNSTEKRDEFLKSLRIGNDATKKATNLNWKWFPAGGFSVAEFVPLLVADFTDEDENNHYNYVQNALAYVTDARAEGPFDFNFPNSPQNLQPTTVTVNNSFVLDREQFPDLDPMIVPGDRIEFSSTVTGEHLLYDITATDEDVSNAEITIQVVAGWTGSDLKAVQYFENKIVGKYIALHVGQDTGKILEKVGKGKEYNQIRIKRFNGVVAPDTILSQPVGQRDRINANKLAYLANEVMNPSGKTDDVISSVPSVSAFLQDLAMPRMAGLIAEVDPKQIIGVTLDVTNDKLWGNPFAIIYEILVDPNWGRGITNDLINIEQLYKMIHKCMQNDPDINDVNWKFGGYALDAKQPVINIIEDILDHVHGGFVERDNKIFFYLDGEVPSGHQVLNMSNVERVDDDDDVGLKIQWIEENEKPNSYDVKYVNPDLDYVYDTYFTISDFADQFFVKIKKTETLELPGFWTKEHAKKSATIMLSKTIYERRIFELHLTATGLGIQEGDFVELSAFGGYIDQAKPSEFNTIFAINDDQSVETYQFAQGNFDWEKINVGSKLVNNHYDYESRIIKDVYINTNKQIEIVVDSAFSNPPDEGFTLYNYSGFRSLKKDVLMRVLQVRIHNDVSITIIGKEYDLRAYKIDTDRYTLQEISARSDVTIYDHYNQTPPKPVITFGRIILQMANRSSTLSNQLIVGLANTDYRSVDRTVITVYAENYNEVGDKTALITSQTIYSREKMFTFNIPVLESPNFDTAGQPIKLKYYVKATSYSSTNIPSRVADSRDDLKKNVNDLPFYILAPDIETGYYPPPAISGADAFDVDKCTYINKLVIRSRIYNLSQGARLELRIYTNLDDEPASWANTDDAKLDGSYIGRWHRLIEYEIDDNLPNSRVLYAMIRIIDANGVYSPSSSILFLQNKAPEKISINLITVETSSNSAIVTVDGASYIQENNNEDDVLKWKLYLVSGQNDVFLGESTKPTIPFAINLALFQGEVFQGKIKVSAVDRLGEGTLSDPVDFTMIRYETSTEVISKLSNAASDQLLRLYSWERNGTTIEDMSYNMFIAIDGSNVIQDVALSPGTYTISWQVVAGNPSLTITVFNVNVDGGVNTKISTGVVKGVLSSQLVFLTFEVSAPDFGYTMNTVEFKISGVNGDQVNEIMLNRGQGHHYYSLHFDDRPIPGQSQATLGFVNQQIVELLEKFKTLDDSVVKQGAQINQHDFELALTVAKNDLVSALVLNEQGALLRGRDIVLDGHTTFLDSTEAVYGKVIKVYSEGVALHCTVSSAIHPEIGDTFFQLVEGKTRQWKVENLSFDSDTGMYLFSQITGDRPVYGLFWNGDTGDITRIHGGAIRTGTLTANQIASKTITANEIASNTIGAGEINVDELFASRIYVIGDKSMVFDSDAGIFILNGAITQNDFTIVAGSGTDTYVEVVVPANEHPYKDDYMYITNGKYAGSTLKILNTNGSRITHKSLPVPIEDGTIVRFMRLSSTDAYLHIGIIEGKPTIKVINGSGNESYFDTDGLHLGTDAVIDWGSVYVNGSPASPSSIGAETPKGAQDKADDAKNAIINGTAVGGTFIDGTTIKENGSTFIDGRNVISPNITGGTLSIGTDAYKELAYNSTDGLMIGKVDSAPISPENAVVHIDMTGLVKAISLKVQHVNKFPYILPFVGDRQVFNNTIYWIVEQNRAEMWINMLEEFGIGFPGPPMLSSSNDIIKLRTVFSADVAIQEGNDSASLQFAFCFESFSETYYTTEFTIEQTSLYRGGTRITIEDEFTKDELPNFQMGKTYRVGNVHILDNEPLLSGGGPTVYIVTGDSRVLIEDIVVCFFFEVLLSSSGLTS